MKDPYAVVQCCDRVQEAVSKKEPSALRHRLRELSDLLEASDIDDPAFNDIRDTAGDLAVQATDIEQLVTDEDFNAEEVIPEQFQQEVIALTQRVCQCYLRVAEIDPKSLPDIDVDPATETIEELVTEQDRLEAETVLWAARAKSVAAERESALEALEQIVDAVDDFDTERRWSPDWESVVEQEREHQRRVEELNKKAKQLKKDIE